MSLEGDMKLSAAAARARLMGPQPSRRKLPPVPPIAIAAPPEPVQAPRPIPTTNPSGYPDMPSRDPLAWRKIAREVADKHKMTVPQVFSHRRNAEYVAARREVWYRLYLETSMSLPQIGRLTGRFDHTTVGFGIDYHRMSIGDEPAWKLAKYRRGE